ncbi:MAG: hypothetical protein WCP97_06255 [bacterium]
MLRTIAQESLKLTTRGFDKISNFQHEVAVFTLRRLVSLELQTKQQMRTGGISEDLLALLPSAIYRPNLFIGVAVGFNTGFLTATAGDKIHFIKNANLSSRHITDAAQSLLENELKNHFAPTVKLGFGAGLAFLTMASLVVKEHYFSSKTMEHWHPGIQFVINNGIESIAGFALGFGLARLSRSRLHRAEKISQLLLKQKLLPPQTLLQIAMRIDASSFDDSKDSFDDLDVPKSASKPFLAFIKKLTDNKLHHR